MSKTTNNFAPEARQPAAHTLLDWVKKVEVNSGKRPGVPNELADRMKALERENHLLSQAIEILRKASAYFAQAELVRPFKRRSRLSMITVAPMGSSRSTLCCRSPLQPMTSMLQNAGNRRNYRSGHGEI
jgi:hypothetical protein